MFKNLIKILVLVLTVSLVGCLDSKAKVVSENISEEADNFEIDRRIVFYNSITGEYILVVEGRCSVTDKIYKFFVTCKVEEEKYIRHQLGRSDNVTYWAEQLIAANVSANHYKIIFRPLTVIPDIDLDITTD